MMVTTPVAQRSAAGQTGTNRALADAVPLIVCTNRSDVQAAPLRHFCAFMSGFWSGISAGLNATESVYTEEFRKQGPCRFGRSATVEACITGDGAGKREGGTCWDIARFLLVYGFSGSG